MNHVIEFYDVKLMAIFLSQLVREGVTYKVVNCRKGSSIYWEIELTGGY